jgi:hypothetical protein
MIILELVSSLVSYPLLEIHPHLYSPIGCYVYIPTLSLCFEDLGSCAILLMLGCSFI